MYKILVYNYEVICHLQNTIEIFTNDYIYINLHYICRCDNISTLIIVWAITKVFHWLRVSHVFFSEWLSKTIFNMDSNKNKVKHFKLNTRIKWNQFLHQIRVWSRYCINEKEEWSIIVYKFRGIIILPLCIQSIYPKIGVNQFKTSIACYLVCIHCAHFNN